MISLLFHYKESVYYYYYYYLFIYLFIYLSIYLFIYLSIFLFIYLFIFSGTAAQRGLWPPRLRGFLITHNDAPQSIGLLWTIDQLVAETST
jgi:hypothetical protein